MTRSVLVPSSSRNHIFLLLLGTSVSFGALGHACSASRKPVEVFRAARHAEPVLLEDELGIPGGPIDYTQFVFEPEEEGIDDPQLVVDGIPDIPDWVTTSLAPYLDSRRTRLQTAATNGAWVVGITRLDQTAQAYRFMAPLEPPQQITNGTEPIVQIASVPKVRDAWVYRADRGGTEDYQIVRTDADSEPALLTDGLSRHGPFAWSASGSALAFTSNARNGRDMDVYIASGKVGHPLELMFSAQGAWSVSSWSPSEQSLLLRRYDGFNQSSIHLLDLASRSMRDLSADGEPAAAHLRARLVGDDTLYATSNRSGEFSHLYRVDAARQHWDDLTPELSWDVEEIALDTTAGRVAYTINEEGLSKLRIYDPARQRSEAVGGVPPGVISDMRFVRSGEALAFTFDTATDTGDIHILDIQRQQLERWTDSRSPELNYDEFVSPSLVRIPSFDGVEVPAFVYASQRPGPSPVLLWIHGGPEQQHQPTFNPMIQYFATVLGVTVIAPNIRGSDGYGRSYVSLDDGFLREDAIADIGAVLDWIAANPKLDPDRVGIYGGSYGGYVVLASLIHHGARLAAGADLVGISNFVTFLEHTGAYRQDQRRVEYGDERDLEMREFLEKISPTTRAAEIQSPLFVAHGANDPRVPLAEAHQIVDAVRSRGKDAWFMVAMDEGHGFYKRANRDQFYAALVAFFAQHLDARPNSEETSQSSEQSTAPPSQ